MNCQVCNRELGTLVQTRLRLICLWMANNFLEPDVYALDIPLQRTPYAEGHISTPCIAVIRNAARRRITTTTTATRDSDPTIPQAITSLRAIEAIKMAMVHARSNRPQSTRTRTIPSWTISIDFQNLKIASRASSLLRRCKRA